jgi:isopenicillin N synthase-like dioxygenase
MLSGFYLLNSSIRALTESDIFFVSAMRHKVRHLAQQAVILARRLLQCLAEDLGADQRAFLRYCIEKSVLNIQAQ